MPTLTPTEAAEIARGVYDLREQSATEALKTGIGTDGMFAVDDSSRMVGKTGALIFKQLSGLGYVAAGVGRFAGEVLIATRGTVVKADWLSNLNIGFEPGPSSLPVHAGFATAWRSIAPELREFFRGHNPSVIHCVGHSLGGALATLSADYCSGARIGAVRLYTFGCPRVGDGFFARTLTSRIGAANMWRVYHPSDPVPMIPIFPFWHAPTGGGQIPIARGDAGLVSVDAHGMAKSYGRAMSGQTWDTLRNAAAVAANEEAQVKSWLERAAEGHGGFVKGSASLLTMIGKALKWLMKWAMKVLVVAPFGMAAAAAATALDWLAALLSGAASAVKSIGSGLKTLIGAIMRFLGRAVPVVADVTVTFLRWVLGLLYESLVAMGRMALYPGALI